MTKEIILLTGGFVLCFIIFGLVERRWPAHPARPLTREFWTTDVLHFFISSTIYKFAVIFIMARIAGLVTYPDAIEAIRSSIGAQPLWLQFIEVVIVSDFVQYWMHRWAHEIPFLWRIHSVHHSSEHMDWVASARAHPVDQIIRRVATLFVLLVLGMSETTFYIYWFIFAPLHSFFIHANFGKRIPFIRYIITTPEYHHWHHVMYPVDKNYSGRFPLFYWMFATYHIPNAEKSSTYGCHEKVHRGYLAQLLHPFRQAEPIEPHDTLPGDSAKLGAETAPAADLSKGSLR